jgi:hypothetical protein
MITVYLTKSFEGKSWIKAKEAIPKMHGWIVIIGSGFGQKDKRIFFSNHQTERIELP